MPYMYASYAPGNFTRLTASVGDRNQVQCLHWHRAADV